MDREQQTTNLHLYPPAPGYKGPMPSHGVKLEEGETYTPRFGFKQVADKHFWITAVALPSAASAFDGWATARSISRGNTEGNPVLGAHPSAGRIAAIKLTFGTVVSICTYVLKKRDMEDDYLGQKRDDFPPRWWKMALLAPALWFAAGGYDLSLGRSKPPTAH